MNSFKIYIPDDRKYFSYNWLIYSCLSISMIPIIIEVAILKREAVSTFSFTLLFIFFPIFVAASLILRLGGFDGKRKLKGVIKGEISFNTDDININQMNYKLEELMKIDFVSYNDYVDKIEKRKGDFDGQKSNGVGNTVILTLKNKKIITCHFQQQFRYQLRELRPMLVHYHNEGKLHFLNLIDILGIVDYNAIQIFKKSLPEGGDVKSY